jgi:hypothetical protein
MIFFVPFLVRQLRPKAMNAIVEQGALCLSRPAAQVNIPVEMVWSCKSQGKAFTMACDASGLEDKEIYLALGIDAGTFSRMKKGDNTISGDRIRDFCKVVGNNVYPQWLAYQIGCGLVVLKSEAELRAEQAETRAKEAEAKVAMLTEIISGRRAA